MELRAPWYARLVGWILVAFGVFALSGLVVGMVTLPSETWATAAALLFAPMATLPIVGGVGTIRSRRWGWIVALIALAAWITYGLTEYTSEATRFQGAGVVEPDPTTITFLVLPGLAMLGALLAPATIRWVRSNSSLA